MIYGLWGLFYFQKSVVGLSQWIATWFGWIPIFKVHGYKSGNPLSSATVFTASTFYRRDRGGPHGHPDPDIDHARGVLAGAAW